MDSINQRRIITNIFNPNSHLVEIHKGYVDVKNDLFVLVVFGSSTDVQLQNNGCASPLYAKQEENEDVIILPYPHLTCFAELKRQYIRPYETHNTSQKTIAISELKYSLSKYGLNSNSSRLTIKHATGTAVINIDAQGNGEFQLIKF